MNATLGCSTCPCMTPLLLVSIGQWDCACDVSTLMGQFDGRPAQPGHDQYMYMQGETTHHNHVIQCMQCDRFH